MSGTPLDGPGQDKTLAERVAAFPRWHYEFDLDGVKTSVFEPDVHNRHLQRERYFVEPLERLCVIEGARILDLGCNAGYWSLKMIERGAAFVHGIDGRQMHIDQANLVFDAKRIDPSRYRFEVSNVFEWKPEEPFDVVLCLGLLYHVAKPFELLERCAAWTRDVLLVDTSLARSGGLMLAGRVDPLDEPRSAVDYELVFYPTRRAVVLMLRQVGFANVVVGKPEFTDWAGSEDFRTNRRRAFFASKATSLDGIGVDPESRLGEIVGIVRWSAGEIRRALLRPANTP